MDPERAKFVHLMDGGMSDNLALRSLSNALVVLDENDEEMRRLATITRRVSVISVDEQATQDPTSGQRRVVSGLGRIISAMSDAQIDAYRFETLLLANQQVTTPTDKIRRVRCVQGKILGGHDCADVKGALIQVSLNDIVNDEKRRRLQAMQTSQTILDADTVALAAEGQTMVDFQPKPVVAISTHAGNSPLD